MEFGSTAFWLALGQIIWINILLSGDNAVVIALAARSLPPKQQKQAIFIGSGAAIVMRIILTLVAAQLLQLPWLKLIGAVLLIYIGVTLLLPEHDGDGDGKGETGGMVAAVRTILIADLVMSLDNVIAVAAAAKGSTTLLVVGLALSIPLVIFGSTLLIKVIERFPFIVWLGAALLGFIAGEIVVEDPALRDWFVALGAQLGITDPHRLGTVMGIVGAIVVVLIGKIMLSRRPSEPAA
ncbi:MAG TPA: TerC family protein [Burkholderiaceae bacterium]|nr:TerC family protein [Burkholderiaceae bacterium]